MRLLYRQQDGSIGLTDYLGDRKPKYAILSHTWLSDDQEVSFEDITHGNVHNKEAGYKKIEFCVERAAENGLNYSWVDTCCICKSDITEFQEAITLMFSWYQRAEKCFAYLSDISYKGNEQNKTTLSRPWLPLFRASRWFTRGWTLQELLAPSIVEFFSIEGIRLGDKKSLESEIHASTGIPHRALHGDDMASFSIDERHSWAQHRQTKKKEDKAYCLLGIFNVQMNLRYGEGHKAFDRLHRKIEKMYLEAADRKNLLQKLPTVPQAAFNSLDNQYGPMCLSDTRVEVLDEIRSWIDGPGNTPMFWLDGIAGMGKSTIARTIARENYDRGQLGASFFFSRQWGDANRVERLITTLASQLATNISQLRGYICEAITREPGIASQSLQDQWDHLIFDPLKKLGQTLSKSSLTIVLIMDALDECGSERDIRIILKLLSTTPQLQPLRLRIVITSRPEISVRHGFSKIPQTDLKTFKLHDIPKSTVSRDIRILFETELEIMREERGLAEDWPGAQKIKRLVEISDGLFLWASTACRFIREGKSLAMRRIDTLIDRHNTASEPEKQLDEIYTTVLRSSVHPGHSDEEKQEVHGILRQLLGSIVILQSPLPMNSLSNFLPLSSCDIKETLADLHTIFNIPADGDYPIYLHHPTFRDFLLNKDRCSDPDFWVDEKQSHKAMADNCVLLMSKTLKTDICNLKQPQTVVDNIDPQHIQKCIAPELEYACRYWVQHYRESGYCLHDGDIAHDFIQSYLLNWLEVMSLTKKISEVSATMRIYDALLNLKHNWRQHSLITDARRFIFSSLSLIEFAPLQTYCAAFAFNSPDNELRHLFWAQMRNWLSDVRIAEPATDKALKSKIRKTFFVNDMVFTPDGRQVAAGSIDNVVRVWDVATRAKRGTFQGQTKQVSSVAISADTLKIVSGSDDSTVLIWDFASRVVLHTLRGHSGWVNSVVFSPDGKLVASGSMDGTVRLWNTETGQQICILEDSPACINAIDFSPDGTLIASGPTDQVIRIRDIHQPGVSITLDGHSGSVNCIRFSPDGKQILSGADDKTVKIWDMNTSEEFKTFKGHLRRVMAVAFSPDAQLIASGSEDETVILWDVSTGSQLKQLSGHTSGINSVAFSPDNQLLVSGSFNDEVRLWDVDRGAALGEFEEFDEKDIPSLRDKMDELKLRSGKTAVGRLTGHSSTVTSLTFSPEGQFVASGSDDTMVKVWSRDAKGRWQLEGHSGGIISLEFSPDSLLLASASADRTVKVWDMENGGLRHTLHGHSDDIAVIRFSSDSRFLISCSLDTSIILWNMSTGKQSQKLEGHRDAVHDVAFSPSNLGLIASCSADATIKLWNSSTGIAFQTLRGHSEPVHSVSFSSNGTRLVSCSADTTVRLWDTDGIARGVLRGHSSAVTCAAFSSDDRLVVSCSDDLTVRVWDVKTKLCRKFPCEVALRTVSFSTCGEYIETNRGLFDIRIPPKISSAPSMLSASLFASNEWVKKGGSNYLLLLGESRAICVAIYSETAVLGHPDGTISFIYF